MVKANLTIHRLSQPLEVPYRLSFGVLEAFESLVVQLTVEGVSGFGEITPLPGYSHETVEGAEKALRRAASHLGRGSSFDETVAELDRTDPMVASALECARETLIEGEEAAFVARVGRPILLNALCSGETPEAAASRAHELVESGYRHLKLKVGAESMSADIARMKAVSECIRDFADLSVDANQTLSFENARRLCDAASGLPVRLVEQPFPPRAWHEFEQLAGESPVPLMLDESIWKADDIDRAADVGASYVKLKLCKHPGIIASQSLIRRAREKGLRVIYGNGVQGALGNHLEARVYTDMRLDTPAEVNGVMKLAKDYFGASLHVEGGYLIDRGMAPPLDRLSGRTPVMETTFMLGTSAWPANMFEPG